MSIKNDLALAYHMGYDDALAKRKPDASKTQMLAPYDLATENPDGTELELARQAENIGNRGGQMDGVDARYLGLTANLLAKIATDLKSENAKLRELARMMWLACKREGIVGGIYAYPDKNSNADERILFEPLLRELGIEGV